eukprot:gene327-588_t
MNAMIRILILLVIFESKFLKSEEIVLPNVQPQLPNSEIHQQIKNYSYIHNNRNLLNQASVANGNIIQNNFLTVSNNLIIGTVTTVTPVDLDGYTIPFSSASYIAVGTDSSVYISDTGNSRIRKLSSTLSLKTIAGDDIGTFLDLSSFKSPTGITVDSNGYVYVVDRKQDRICRLTVIGFIATVTTIAGSITGGGGKTSYDGQGTAATFNGPYGIAIGTSGALFVTEYKGNVVRKIDPSNNYRVTTIVPVSAGLNEPTGIATDGRGNVLVLDDDDSRILKFTETGTISQLTLSYSEGYSFNGPYGIAIYGSNTFISDYGNDMISIVSDSGIVSYFAGSGENGLINGIGATSSFYEPEGLACDALGNIYVLDSGNNKIRYVASSIISDIILPSVVTTIAGSVSTQSGATDGTGTSALFNSPRGMAIDSSSNNIYVTDHHNRAIRMIVSTTYQVITIAGNGKGTFTGDQNGIVDPVGITVNTDGFIYFTDYSSCKIRKITLSGTVGTVTTVAGAWTTPSTPISKDGTGTVAAFNGPYGIAAGSNGVLYVTELDGNSIRKIDIRNNVVVTTIGLQGVKLDSPSAITVDYNNNIFIADNSTTSLVKITQQSTSVNRFPLTFPMFYDPNTANAFGITSYQNTIYLTDTYNNVIRSISSTGEVYSIAGDGTEGYLNSVGSSSRFSLPEGIITDSSGNLIIADTSNNVIRLITIDRSSKMPSVSPTRTPSITPTKSNKPTVKPSSIPTVRPTSSSPSVSPSRIPTPSPSVSPTSLPSTLPSIIPSRSPSISPSTITPSRIPSTQPSTSQSNNPSFNPTTTPSTLPTWMPSSEPFLNPSRYPTSSPSLSPSAKPFVTPSDRPTAASDVPTKTPSTGPSVSPSTIPTISPSSTPSTVPSMQPSMTPSTSPITIVPSLVPSMIPSPSPSQGLRSAHENSQHWSLCISEITDYQSHLDAIYDSFHDSFSITQSSMRPSNSPSASPSRVPLLIPVTEMPTDSPTSIPSMLPSMIPSPSPSFYSFVSTFRSPHHSTNNAPSDVPSLQPSGKPSAYPSTDPSIIPSPVPSSLPTSTPSTPPNPRPTIHPSLYPSSGPTLTPSYTPSNQPTKDPTVTPSRTPSQLPSPSPSTQPLINSLSPVINPTESPTAAPTSFFSNFNGSSVQEAPPSDTNLWFSSWSNTQADMTVSQSKWNEFVKNALITPFRVVYQSIRVNTRVLFNGDSSPSSRNPLTCNDSVLAGQIIGAITSNTSIAVECNGRPWAHVNGYLYVGSNLNRRLCVGCALPTCPDPSLSYVIVPVDPSCQDNLQFKLYVDVSIQFTAVVPSTVPVITMKSSSATVSSVTVAFISSAAGRVYCGAFPSYTTSPKSVYDVKLQETLSTKIQVTTLCCRGIVFPQQSSSSPSSIVFDTDISTAINTLSYRLTSAPDDSLVVKPVFYYPNGTICPNVVGKPSSAIFGRNNGLSSMFLVSGPSGVYRLRMSLSGSDVAKYASDSITVTIKSGDKTVPTAPPLSLVQFSDSGDSISVLFSASTNLAGITTSTWPCNRIFDFSGVDYTTCFWTNSSAVKISFQYVKNVDYVYPGDIILLKSNVITASCVKSSPCSNYPTNNVSAMIVLPPLKPISPTIVMKVPSTVDYCSQFIIDVSGSYGNGGRQWDRIEWRLYTHNDTIIPTVTTFLNRFTDLSSPITVSTALLNESAYTLSLSLTNFLNQTSIKSAVVHISRSSLNVKPQVSIVGSASRVIYRSQVLTIAATVLSSNCSLFNRVSYLWKAYRNLVYLGNVASVSKDPRRLTVPAYKLAVGYTYQFVVTVTTATGSSNVAFADVYVKSSNIEAQMTGGQKRSVSIAQSTVLDASKSYDPDIVPTDNQNIGFKWSCIIVSIANYGKDCSGFVNGSDATNHGGSDGGGVVTLGSGVLSTNSTYLFTVQVYSLSDSSRWSVATTVVNVLTDTGAVTGRIISPSTLFTPSKVLTINTLVTGNHSITAVWSVTDTHKQLNLLQGQQTQTPLSQSFSRIEVLNSIQFPLSILSNVLTPGGTYTFRLSLTSTDLYRSVVTYDEIVLTARSPPTSGIFIIYPTNGTALQTNFFFSASHWTGDSDQYPLLFEFLYTPYIGAPNLSISSPAELSHVYSQLPAGMQAEDYRIYCSLLVSDTSASTTTTTISVKVLAGSQVVDTSRVMSILQTELPNQLSNLNMDSATQTVNTVANTLNSVNCTGAWYCFKFHRKPCQNVINTCGECMSGYVGVTGPHNSLCHNASSSSSSSSSQSDFLDVGETCTIGSQSRCIYGLCERNRCSVPMKTCGSDVTGEVCSGHGSCQYYTPSNNQQIDSCLVTDSTCVSQCVCESGYGGVSCHIRDYELSQRSLARSKMCEALLNISDRQDPSSSFLTSQSGSLRIIFDPNQITSFHEADKCSQVLVNVLNLVTSGYLTSVSSNVIQVLYDIISTFVDWLRINQYSNYVAMSDTISSALIVLQDGIHGGMVAGQFPVIVTTDNVIVSIHFDLTSSLHGINISASSGSSSSSSYSASVTSSSSHITLPASGVDVCGYTDGYSKYSVLQTGNTVFTNETDLVSGTIQVAFAPSTTRSTLITEVVNFTLVQQFSTPQNLSHRQLAPQCMEIGGVDGSNGNNLHSSECRCRLKEFTAYSATFDCYDVYSLCSTSSVISSPLSLSSVPHLSQFSHSASSLGVSDTVSHQYTTTLKNVGDHFVLTTQARITVDQILMSSSAVSVLASIIFGIIFGLIYFNTWDRKDRNVTIYVKNVGVNDDDEEDLSRIRSSIDSTDARILQRLKSDTVTKMTLAEECDDIIMKVKVHLKTAFDRSPLPWTMQYAQSNEVFYAKSIMTFLGVDESGNFLPLSWYKTLRYGTPRKRMESKIRKARAAEKAIRKSLDVNAINLMSVVQHYSGACRAARTLKGSKLAMGFVLQNLRDPDALNCQFVSTMNKLGFLGILVLGAAHVFHLDESADVVFTIFWSMVYGSFLLFNALLLQISPVLLVGVYVSLTFPLLIYIFIFKPVHIKHRNKGKYNGLTQEYEQEQQEQSALLDMKITLFKLFTDDQTVLTRSQKHELHWRNMNMTCNRHVRVSTRALQTFFSSQSKQSFNVAATMRRLSITFSPRPARSRDDSTVGKWRKDRMKALRVRDVYRRALLAFLDLDTTHRGYLTHTEIERFVSVYWKSLKMEYETSWTMDDVMERVDRVLNDLDPHVTGMISYDTFKVWFRRFEVDFGVAEDENSDIGDNNEDDDNDEDDEDGSIVRYDNHIDGCEDNNNIVNNNEEDDDYVSDEDFVKKSILALELSCSSMDEDYSSLKPMSSSYTSNVGVAMWSGGGGSSRYLKSSDRTFTLGAPTYTENDQDDDDDDDDENDVDHSKITTTAATTTAAAATTTTTTMVNFSFNDQITVPSQYQHPNSSQVGRRRKSEVKTIGSTNSSTSGVFLVTDPRPSRSRKSFTLGDSRELGTDSESLVATRKYLEIFAHSRLLNTLEVNLDENTEASITQSLPFVDKTTSSDSSSSNSMSSNYIKPIIKRTKPNLNLNTDNDIDIINEESEIDSTIESDTYEQQLKEFPMKTEDGSNADGVVDVDVDVDFDVDVVQDTLSEIEKMKNAYRFTRTLSNTVRASPRTANILESVKLAREKSSQLRKALPVKMNHMRSGWMKKHVQIGSESSIKFWKVDSQDMRDDIAPSNSTSFSSHDTNDDTNTNTNTMANATDVASYQQQTRPQLQLQHQHSYNSNESTDIFDDEELKCITSSSSSSDSRDKARNNIERDNKLRDNNHTDNKNGIDNDNNNGNDRVRNRGNYYIEEDIDDDNLVNDKNGDNSNGTSDDYRNRDLERNLTPDIHDGTI